MSKKTSYILKESHYKAIAIIQGLLTTAKNHILMNIKSLK